MFSNWKRSHPSIRLIGRSRVNSQVGPSQSGGNRPRAPRQYAYLFFLIPGLVALALGVYFGISVAIGNALINLGVALSAVALIEWTWSFLGGAPLQQEIVKFEYTTATALQDLWTATDALKDLQETGITHLYPQRLKIIGEKIDWWIAMASEADEVDLMGLTLHRDWFEHSPLREALKDVVQKNGGKVRIVLLDRPRP